MNEPYQVSPAPANGRPWRRAIILVAPLLGVVAVAVLLAARTMSPVAVPSAGAGGSPAPADTVETRGLPTPSLASDFPSFPLPADAKLVGASSAQGDKSFIFGIWTTGQPYQDVAVLVAKGSTRWQLVDKSDGSDGATYWYSDSTGAFLLAYAIVERTTPVTVSVHFLSAAAAQASDGLSPRGVPAPSDSSGPSLPPDFPASLIPGDSTLLREVDSGTDVVAVFSSHTAASDLAPQMRAAIAGLGGTVTVDRTDGALIHLEWTGARPGAIDIRTEGDASTTVGIEIR